MPQTASPPSSRTVISFQVRSTFYSPAAVASQVVQGSLELPVTKSRSRDSNMLAVAIHAWDMSIAAVKLLLLRHLYT